MVFEKCKCVKLLFLSPILAMCDFYPENHFGKIRPKNESILADFARLGLFLVQYSFYYLFSKRRLFSGQILGEYFAQKWVF